MNAQLLGHPDRNLTHLRESLLDGAPLAAGQIHAMPVESADLETGARQYAATLEQIAGSPPVLDLVHLGLGPDGHTASLFPHTAALSETRHRCVANRVPKVNAWRLTLTFPFINRSREVLVLVTGAGKAARVQQALEGPREPQELPIQGVGPASGRLMWLLDAAAAGMG
jgi:6-phosphogluconolactonase